MKNILSILLFSVLGFGLFSCETVVDDLPLSRFPEIKEKLVLTSFISPQDTMIFVKVTISSPLFGDYKSQGYGYSVVNGDTTYSDASNVAKDAIVTLSNGSQSINLPFQFKNQIFALSTKLFKIEAGKTYTLKATTKTLQAEASTTIPLESIKIDSYQADSTGRVMRWFSSNQGSQQDTVSGYEVSFSWKDLAQKSNFYKIGGEMEFYYEYPSFKDNVVTYKTQKGVAVINNWYDEKAYISDDGQDGMVITSPKGNIFKQAGSYTINGKNYKIKPSKLGSKIKLQLFNLSKEFYDYQLSLFKFNSVDGNPFAEPAPVFSNVKNGLGCFAGYNRSEVVFQAK